MWSAPGHPPCSIFSSPIEPPSPCSFSVRSAPLRFYSVGPRFSTRSQRSSAILSLDINRRSPRFCLAALALGIFPSLISREDLHRHTHGQSQVRLLSGERLELVQLRCLREERVRCSVYFLNSPSTAILIQAHGFFPMLPGAHPK